MEDAAIQVGQEVVQKTISTVESTLKKIWSVLDAASEKKVPSEILSQQGIKAIQGNM